MTEAAAARGRVSGPRRDETPTGLALYDATALAASAVVIERYSTSFGMATKLLGRRVRPHVRAIYALVRVADEIVDGPAAEAGLSPAETREVLDELEAEVHRATARGFSANVVVHAFALTARECGIGEALTAPFFRSMRTDAIGAETASGPAPARHDRDSHADYVYGSAEVVGLMCLQTFARAGRPGADDPSPELIAGARRLGAAFQNVNFLRDLDHDAASLGRDYLGGVGAALAGDDGADAATVRTAILDDIDADLAAAAAVMPLLPADCRRAVTAAHDLFAELSNRLRRVHPSTRVRVRVPDATKALLVARAMSGAPPRAPRGAASAAVDTPPDSRESGRT